jgi:energy-coupling factor transporter ATP-binding protein EcfA2
LVLDGLNDWFWSPLETKEELLIPFGAIALTLIAPNFNWFVCLVGLLLVFLMGLRTFSMGLCFVLLLSLSPFTETPMGLLVGRVLTASLWLHALSFSTDFQRWVQKRLQMWPELAFFRSQARLVRDDFRHALEHTKVHTFVPYMKRLVPVFALGFHRSFSRLMGVEEVRQQRKATSLAVGPIKVMDVQVDIKGNPLLKGLHFEVPTGETLVCYGDVGAGKTTLLRTIAGLRSFSAGSIERAGQILLPCQAPPPCRSVRWVSQNPCFQLIGGTPEEEIELALSGLVDKKDWLRLCGLDHLRYHSTLELSFGEQKKLVLLSALASGARTLLLDEPTAGLSQEASEHFLDCIEALRLEYPLTIIWATHHLAHLPKGTSRVLTLAAGTASVQSLSSFSKGPLHDKNSSDYFDRLLRLR